VRIRIIKTPRINESALKHGIAIADIEHALRHPMHVVRRDDGAHLYLGAGRNAPRYANLLGSE
jgi:hypothetical protein